MRWDRTFLRLWAVACIVLCLVLTPAGSRAASPIVNQRYDTSRTAATLEETDLTTSSVNANKFGKIFSRSVLGSVYAQPLYVPSLTIPGQGTHDVVFVATMHNTVYAFDANDPNATTP